ncbi:unnamed protein product [Urochloa decumbens]|uniref:F-box domain-containing protein n=1 Tax=Urochloa decumbens TaxID=240449 RepID=A0ABC9FLP8_9POAL
MAPPHAPPELMADPVEEILLRLPPGDPACLVRASLVCKPWCRLLSAPSFRRRYRAFHRAPPLLGFLHQHHAVGVGNLPRFVPTVTPCPFPKQAFGGCAHWCVLDCRHGRVLFDVPFDSVNLAVWEPITGKRQQLPKPPICLGCYNAAVLCAVRGCDHLDCSGGPFFVVLVGSRNILGSHLYSSEAGAWIASADLGTGYLGYRKPSVLIRDDVYFVLIVPRNTILKYNLGKNCLTIIQSPVAHDTHGDIALMPMEDGSLGFASVLGSKLCLWSWNEEVVAGWVEFRAIELETLIPSSSSIEVVGSAEGIDVIFVTTNVGAFTIELKSGQVKKVGKPWECCTVFPFMSFYTPGCACSILPSAPAEAH